VGVEFDITITGGNQRDLAREKAQAKAKEAQKGQRKDGVSPAQRQLQ
jgi:hypothetical protein